MDAQEKFVQDALAFERRNQFWLRVMMAEALILLVMALWSLPAHAQVHVSVDIDLRGLIGRLEPRTPPKVTCGIETVGYRFIGPAGRKLRYAGDTYEIEQDGDLELIADKRRRTYAVDGRSLPLDVWPKNAFGFREVPVK